MDFIQTLYLDKSKDPYGYSFGWAAPVYHLMSWALSCLQLTSLYGKINLYCNTEAAHLLNDTLGLPYNKLICSHDDIDIAHNQLWALPKIYTYALQNEPFLHIDGDVFLFNKLPDHLLNGSLIAQNVEDATDYYMQTQKQLMQHFSYFPNCVSADFNSELPIKAVNAGILGGSNIAFIKEYTDLAFKYINDNTKHLSSINVDRFNVFFEQHLFYSLAKQKQIPIEVLINSTVKDNEYLYLGNFHEVPCKRRYLHLLGQYKKDEHTCLLMAAKLRQLYPEYYYRIISLFKKKGFLLSTGSCNNFEAESEDDFIKFGTEAKDIFINNHFITIKTESNHSLQQDKNLSAITFLENIVNDLDDDNSLSKEELKNDLTSFSKNLQCFLNDNSNINYKYNYGRDLEAVNWFCQIFADEVEMANKSIIKNEGLHIIISGFDWAGLFNKHKRVGVKYYEHLMLIRGEFYNLIIPEFYGDGFSLQDMDEMEKIILEHILEPTSIKSLFKIMLDYVDEDIVNNHLEEYEELIVVMLKQLVLKKAIRPLKNSITQI